MSSFVNQINTSLNNVREGLSDITKNLLVEDVLLASSSNLLAHTSFNKKIEIETEIRFKSYKLKAFEKGINLNEYYTVLNHFNNIRDKDGKEGKESDGQFILDYNHIITEDHMTFKNNKLRVTVNPDGTRYLMEKNKINYDDRSYNMRFSVATETLLPYENLPSIDMIRVKYRDEFVLAPGIRLHITRIDTYTKSLLSLIIQRLAQLQKMGKFPGLTMNNFSILGLKDFIDEVLPTANISSCELELEYNSNEYLNNSKLLIDKIQYIFKILHDTELVYSINEYMNIVDFYNINLVGTSRDPYSFSKKPLFQSRNLKKQDLTGGELSINFDEYDPLFPKDLQIVKGRMGGKGGIINSVIADKVKSNTGVDEDIVRDITYTLTIKADGQRKLLIINEDGLWLVMAPNYANLISTSIRNKSFPYRGLILEVEYIPLNKRNKEYGPTEHKYNESIIEYKTAYKHMELASEYAKYKTTKDIGFEPTYLTTKYLIMIYDCLSESNNNTPNLTIQRNPHSTRMRQAQQYANILNSLVDKKFMTILTKDFFGFSTADDMFRIVRMLQNRKLHLLPYIDDGMMITADEMAYNEQRFFSSRQITARLWHSIAVNTWIDSYGTQMNLVQETDSDGQIINKLYEVIGNKKVISFNSDDTVWYTRDANVYIENGKSGIFYPEKSGRIWTNRAPEFWGKKDKDGRPLKIPEQREQLNVVKIIQLDENNNDITNTHNLILEQRIEINLTGVNKISDIPLNSRYLNTMPDICKWKPPHQLTIDFLIRRNKQGKIELYSGGFDKGIILFEGNDRYPFIKVKKGDDYEFLIDHDHSLTKNINNVIVEYTWNIERNMMVPHGLRLDKDRPNQITYARNIWTDINDPITLSTMIGESLTLMRQYHNAIKTQLFKEAFDTIRKRNRKIGNQTINLLDIGSGRGGDIAKFRMANRIVLVEPDRENIGLNADDSYQPNQLLDRLYKQYNHRIMIIYEDDMTNGKLNDKLQSAKNDGHSVVLINTKGQNTTLIKAVVEQWMGKADIISLMLSMTFFWQSSDSVNDLVRTIEDNLSQGGVAVYFTMDGKKVLNLFEGDMFNNITSNASNLDTVSQVTDDPYNKMVIQPDITAPLDDLDHWYNSVYKISPQGHKMVMLNDAGLKMVYYKDENKLDIDIPDTIVGFQTEWLVDLKDLQNKMNGYIVSEDINADRELLLNRDERLWSSLYTGGLILKEDDTYNNMADTLLSSIYMTSGKVQASTVSDEVDRPKINFSTSSLFKTSMTPSAIKQLSSSSTVLSNPATGAIKVVSNPSPFTTQGVTSSPFVSTASPFASSSTASPFASTPSPFASTPSPFVSSSTASPFVSTPSPFTPTVTASPFVSSSSPFTPTVTPRPFAPTVTASPFIPKVISSPFTPTVTPTATPSPFVIIPSSFTPTITPSPFAAQSSITNPFNVVISNINRSIVSKDGGDDINYLLKNINTYKIRRVAVINNDSFFHAILKAHYKPYGIDNSYSNRMALVNKFRQEIANSIDKINNQTGKTYYDGMSNGILLKMVDDQAKGVIVSFDAKLENVKNMLKEGNINNILYQYIADILNINIYIMDKDMNIKTKYDNAYSNRVILLLDINGEYELLGSDEAYIRTIFDKNEELIKSL